MARRYFVDTLCCHWLCYVVAKLGIFCSETFCIFAHSCTTEYNYYYILYAVLSPENLLLYVFDAVIFQLADVGFDRRV